MTNIPNLMARRLLTFAFIAAVMTGIPHYGAERHGALKPHTELTR